MEITKENLEEIVRETLNQISPVNVAKFDENSKLVITMRFSQGTSRMKCEELATRYCQKIVNSLMLKSNQLAVVPVFPELFDMEVTVLSNDTE